MYLHLNLKPHPPKSEEEVTEEEVKPDSESNANANSNLETDKNLVVSKEQHESMLKQIKYLELKLNKANMKYNQLAKQTEQSNSLFEESKNKKQFNNDASNSSSIRLSNGQEQIINSSDYRESTLKQISQDNKRHSDCDIQLGGSFKDPRRIAEFNTENGNGNSCNRDNKDNTNAISDLDKIPEKTNDFENSLLESVDDKNNFITCIDHKDEDTSQDKEKDKDEDKVENHFKREVYEQNLKYSSKDR